jgi:hypothetical protein
MILEFGKFEGYRIDKVEEWYLLFLAGEEVSNENAFKWVKKNYPEVVKEAIRIMWDRRKNGYKECQYCGGTLVPVGHSRANGADHPDWKQRKYHKKCYAELNSN